MSYNQTKNKWNYRQCDCEWNVIGKTRLLTCAGGRWTAKDAAENAAAALDMENFNDDFDSATVAEVDSIRHYIEVECGNGEWRRFIVRTWVRIEYTASEFVLRNNPKSV